MVDITDSFPGAPRQLTYPAAGAVAVSPNDTTNLTFTTRGVYVGTTGNLTVIMQGDASLTPVTFASVQAGSLLPLRVIRVMTTNTTASNIVAVQ